MRTPLPSGFFLLTVGVGTQPCRPMAMNAGLHGPFSKRHFPWQGLTACQAHGAQLSGEARQALPQLCQGQ